MQITQLALYYWGYWQLMAYLARHSQVICCYVVLLGKKVSEIVNLVANWYEIWIYKRSMPTYAHDNRGPSKAHCTNLGSSLKIPICWFLHVSPGDWEFDAMSGWTLIIYLVTSPSPGFHQCLHSRLQQPWLWQKTAQHQPTDHDSRNIH